MGNKRNVKSWLTISVFLVAIGCASASGATIYVDASATGANDGSSWADAYEYLQDALYKPPSGGDEIWVAEGTYKPDADSANPAGTGDQTATFQLISGVGIYGGIGGGQSILSGDIGTPGFMPDNSYHVVYARPGTDETAVLDGFTITGGNANGGDWPTKVGGGMYNSYSSPTVTNCIFSGNSADYNGGGICNVCNYDYSPTITNCTFSANTAGVGGGMCNMGESSPTVTNCTFSGNSAGNNGGGMRNHDASPTVTNCIFIGNSAEDGGGMFNLTDMLHCDVYSDPTLTNCTFSGNSASRNGGGMYNSTSEPTVTNCTFSGNSAGSNGGGIYNYSSPPTSPTITNCILWGDTANIGNEIRSLGDSNPNIYYSDIEGCGGSGATWDTSLGIDGGGNIDADPLFADTDGRLSTGSPCIDAGDDSAVTVTTDLDGNPRIVGAAVDMGAYESPFEPELPCGPVSKWPGDEHANDVVGGNHGTLVNGATFASGLVNQAFSFDGEDDYVLIPASPDFTVEDQFTIEFWCSRRGDGDTCVGSILSSSNSFQMPWQVYFGCSNTLGMRIGRSPDDADFVWSTSTFSPDDPAWLHFAGTYNGVTNEAKVYINGVLENTVSTTGIAGSDFDVVIGTLGYENSSYFNGLIDEVAIYNCALDADEIWAIFLASSPSSPVEATEDLIEDIEEMGLPKGIENSLVSKLENAIKSMDKGQDNAAANQLNAFINQVEAQRGKKIPEADADALIAAAQSIIDNISNNGS